jgi:hypothetical protein
VVPKDDDGQQLKDKVTQHQRELDELIKYLTEIVTYFKAESVGQRIENLTIRHGLTPEPEEQDSFQPKMLPYQYNRNFYERRGVGKTETALEHTLKNPSAFDAIFWIGCDTSPSRQSFNNMARSKCYWGLLAPILLC